MILFLFSPFGWVELGILDIRMLYILSFTLTEIVCAAGQASQFYAPGWLFGIGRWEWKSEAWGWHACTFCIRHRYLPLTSSGFLGLLQILDYWKGAYFLFFFYSENFWLHPGWKLCFKIFLLFLEAPLKHHRLWSNLAELNCVDLTLLDLKFFLSAKSF